MTLLGLGHSWLISRCLLSRTLWPSPLLNPNWFGLVGTPPQTLKLLYGGDLLKRLASKSYPVSGLGMTMAFFDSFGGSFQNVFLFEDWRWTHWEFSFQVMIGMGLANEPPTSFIILGGGSWILCPKTPAFEVKVLLQRKTPNLLSNCFQPMIDGWLRTASSRFQLPGTPSVLFFLGNFTPKTSNYCLKNRALGFPGIQLWGFFR